MLSDVPEGGDQNPGRRLNENVQPRETSKRCTASNSKIIPAAFTRAPTPALRRIVVEALGSAPVQNRPKSENTRPSIGSTAALDRLLNRLHTGIRISPLPTNIRDAPRLPSGTRPGPVS